MIFKFLQKYPPSMMVNMSPEPADSFIARYILENKAPDDIEFDEYYNEPLMNHPNIKCYSEKEGFIRYFMDANFLCAHYLEIIKEYGEEKQFFEDYTFYTVITEQIGFVPNQYAGNLNIRLSIMQCNKGSKFIQDYQYGTLNKKLNDRLIKELE